MIEIRFQRHKGDNYVCIKGSGGAIGHGFEMMEQIYAQMMGWA